MSSGDQTSMGHTMALDICLIDEWANVLWDTHYTLHNGRMTRSPVGDNQSDVSCATALCFCSFDEFENVTSVRGGLCVYNYDL